MAAELGARDVVRSTLIYFKCDAEGCEAQTEQLFPISHHIELKNTVPDGWSEEIMVGVTRHVLLCPACYEQWLRLVEIHQSKRTTRQVRDFVREECRR